MITYRCDRCGRPIPTDKPQYIFVPTDHKIDAYTEYHGQPLLRYELCNDTRSR